MALGLKDERTPLAPEPRGGGGAAATWELLHTGGLALSTITLSVGLINFNSYLMREGHFPYAGPLVFMQMGFCSALSVALLAARPALFPSMSDPLRRVSVDRRFMAFRVLPIGTFFGASMVLNTMAMGHLSVPFVQMTKESSIILVYVLSLIVGLERFSCRQVQVIAFATLGATLMVKGELHFSTCGFLELLSAQFCECVRIVLQALLLGRQKMDALSYVLIISPTCFVLMGCLLGAAAVLPGRGLGPGLPPASALCGRAPVIVANCLVSFFLNLSIALLIKRTSAMGYIFCGMVKDVLMVLVSVLVLKDRVSQLQVAAFCMQVASVLIWSMLKSDPERFERGLCRGLASTLWGDAGAAAEAPPRGSGCAAVPKWSPQAEEAPEHEWEEALPRRKAREAAPVCEPRSAVPA